MFTQQSWEGTRAIWNVLNITVRHICSTQIPFKEPLSAKWIQLGNQNLPGDLQATCILALRNSTLFIHPSIQQTRMAHLLYARNGAEQWGRDNGAKRGETCKQIFAIHNKSYNRGMNIFQRNIFNILALSMTLAVGASGYLHQVKKDPFIPTVFNKIMNGFAFISDVFLHLFR